MDIIKHFVDQGMLEMSNKQETMEGLMSALQTSIFLAQLMLMESYG